MAVKPVVHDDATNKHRPLGSGEKMDGLSASSIISSQSGNLITAGSDGLAYATGSGVIDPAADNLLEATSGGKVKMDMDRIVEWLDGHPQDAAALAAAAGVRPVSEDAGNIVSAGSDGGAFLDAGTAAEAVRGELSSGMDIGGARVSASGTDALRTLSDRFADVANVKDYGAKGDGETDDTAAFQAAAAAGVPVYVPAGVYAVSGAVSGDFFSLGGVSFVPGGAVDVRDLTESPDDAGLVTETRFDALSLNRPSSFVGQLVDMGGETNWQPGVTVEDIMPDPWTGEIYVHTADRRADSVAQFDTYEVDQIKRLAWDESTKTYRAFSASRLTDQLGHQGMSLYRPGPDSQIRFFSYRDFKLVLARWSGVNGDPVVIEREFDVLDDTMAKDVNSVERPGFSQVVYTGLCPKLSPDQKQIACRCVRLSDTKIVFRVWDVARLLSGGEDQTGTYEYEAVEPDWSVWSTNTTYDISRQSFCFDGRIFYCFDSHTGYSRHYVKAFDADGNVVCERPGTMEGIVEDYGMRSFEGESIAFGKNRAGEQTLLMAVSIFDTTYDGPISVKHHLVYDLLHTSAAPLPLAVSRWIYPDVITKLEPERVLSSPDDDPSSSDSSSDDEPLSAGHDVLLVKNEGLVLNRSGGQRVRPAVFRRWGEFAGSLGITSGYLMFESVDDLVLTAKADVPGAESSATSPATVRVYSNSAYKAFAPGPFMESGSIDLGNASYPWGNFYHTDGGQEESDERLKQDIEDIPEAVLQAWGDVGFCQYRKRKSVAKKGDGARLHAGCIAQRVKEAFERRGLDPFAYGVLCHDSWDAAPAVVDSDTGDVVEPERQAGDVYTLRYEEALVLECAYQRRVINDLAARVAALEAAK